MNISDQITSNKSLLPQESEVSDAFSDPHDEDWAYVTKAQQGDLRAYDALV
ncbi:MAG: hypothetical protein RLY69_1271, partial [Verrucomicrobiota bacterium]